MFDGVSLVAQLKEAKSVLATLWSVEDESTASMISDFYQRLVTHKGLSKAQVLRTAQVNMLSAKRGKFSSPYY